MIAVIDEEASAHLLANDEVGYGAVRRDLVIASDVSRDVCAGHLLETFAGTTVQSS